jgi:hypothetical protein
VVSFYLIATKVDGVYEITSASRSLGPLGGRPMALSHLCPALLPKRLACLPLPHNVVACSSHVSAVPYRVKQLLTLLSVSVSIGMDGISTPLQCLGFDGFRIRLLCFMLAPALLSAAIVAAVSVRQLVTRRPLTTAAYMDHALPVLLKLLFIAYPLVTNVAFEAFPCHDFDDSAWLKADVSIPCYTPEHDAVIRLAAVAIFVYPVGLLVLNAALLFLARKAIANEQPTPLSRATAFLHREYEPHMAW